MTEQRKKDTHERVQIIALGVHAITDRFSAHEHAFGQRLKEMALELIEDIALYEIARTRDAAGTAKLIHKLIGNADGLKSLLLFVKHRGLAQPTTVDVLDWELDRLLGDLKREDARFEEHVSLEHPRGERVHSAPTIPQQTAGLISTEPPKRTIPAPKPKTEAPEPVYPERSRGANELPRFDPLLGPDLDVPRAASQETGSNPLSSGIPGVTTSASGSHPEGAAEVVPPGLIPNPSGLTPQPSPASATAVATPPAALPTVRQTEQPVSEVRNDSRPVASPEPLLRTSASSLRGSADLVLSNRQHKIMNFFRHQKEAPLKTVMQAALPNVSEKTVRNDLLVLVQSGLLRRTGKAPRSRYVIAK